jgi:pimeloyl-ACP methyl ester carboxylesterase
MPIAQLSKVKIEYFSHGHGPRKVAFIHGFQASARIWRMVQEALPADAYTSIAINNRGAGASEAPPSEDDFSVPIFAADAFELTSQLGWRDFTLVGHSLGGPTSMAFAVDHPEVLNGLVLLDPADPDGREIAGGEAAISAMLDRMIEGRRAQQARGAPGDAIDAAGAGVSAELMKALAEDMRTAPERRLRGSMRSMFSVRMGAQVKTLPMPVLMAAGDADELIPIAAMMATWAKLPAGSGLHVWHGVGHSPNLDCPEELAAVIRRFVEVTIPARAKTASAAAS